MKPPLLDKRSRDDVLEEALTLAGRNPPPGWTGYVPAWQAPAVPGDPGHRVIELFARMAELLIERLNRMPEKNFLAFLDLAGVERFPGAPARVPVTFTVSAKAPVGGTVPERTQVATTQTKSTNARVFETRREFFASKARIGQVIAIHPATDRHAVLSTPLVPPTAASLAVPAVSVLTAASPELQPVPHVLFLGSESLFGRKVPVDVSVTIQYTGASFPTILRWSRWDKASKSWVTLTPTVSLSPGAPATFSFPALADVGKLEVNGIEDHWLAAELDADPANPAPSVTSIRGVIAPVAVPEAPLDAAIFNTTTLDATKPFAPFGSRPVYGDVLYLASRAGFAPDNERFTLTFGIRPYRNTELQSQFTGIRSNMTIRTVARWEYLDVNERWQPLRQFDHEFRFTVGASPGFAVTVARAANPVGDPAGEGTFIGTADAAVEVQVVAPTGLDDIGLHERNGVESRWLRVLLVSENPYGIEGVITGSGETTRFVGPLLIPPRIESVRITYIPPVADRPIEHVQTLNNFEWRDHSGATGMVPFVPVSGRQVGAATVFGAEPALYVGCDRAFEPSAFISLFVDLAGPSSTFSAELESGEPQVVWEYWNDGWLPLDVTDETLDLTTSGTVAFLAPAEATSLVLAEHPGREDVPAPVARWWIRARLAGGRFDFPPRVRGVYLNTVMADNRSTFATLLVGSSNGEPDQRFQLVKVPVLAGELWVREPDIPTAPELRDLRDEEDEDRALGAAGETTDPLDAGGDDVWVRWRRVPNFELSGPRSRHYVLDAASGRLQFGGGADLNGLIPPPGRNNLVLRKFETGGGADANREAGALAVRELKTSLPFVDRVFNVQSAAGGSSEWSLGQLLDLGPQSLKTRGHAVTTEDYESLVLQHFSEVARARCAPVSAPGVGGTLVFSAGSVTMLIVPRGADARPQPSAGLIRNVREFLAATVLRNIRGDVHVKGPDYVAVDIEATLVATRPELVNVTQRRAEAAIEQFLHPLTGGEDGLGYSFGRPVYLSEVHAVLERVEGVHHVVSARFATRPGEIGFRVDGEKLASSGTHRITVRGP